MMGRLIPPLKEASLLWLEGFREACSVARVVVYCRRSRELAVRTGQCFLLNGFIFLGSIYLLESFVIPVLQWLLPVGCPQNVLPEPCPFENVSKFYSALQNGLVHLFYVFWFYPMYISSFILSMIWYGDIAKHGLFAVEKDGTKPSGRNEPSKNATDIEGIVIGIAEQLYSVLLLNFFLLQVMIIGFIPLLGKPLSFVLLTWLYAYYCFEYKWSYSGVSLDLRLDFFESNWPFFSGFGSPCVLASFFFSPLISYGVMAILFPLFVLTATGSEADRSIVSERRKSSSRGGSSSLSRLPIFVAADYFSMKVLSFLPVNPSRRKSHPAMDKEL